jgi:hypothetical protein
MVQTKISKRLDRVCYTDWRSFAVPVDQTATRLPLKCAACAMAGQSANGILQALKLHKGSLKPLFRQRHQLLY